MKRYIFIIFYILIGFTVCYAQTISTETAMSVGQTYWNITYANNRLTSQTKEAVGVQIISPNNKAPLFVIQMEDGWVLVSSEKAANPILASSPVGEFPSYKDMPEGMQWILSYYEEANQYARDSLKGKIVESEEWAQLLDGSYTPEIGTRALPSSLVLSRMESVRWGQGSNNDLSCTKPFNAHCPTWYTTICGHTLVGCGAVALGQILWYWQWPYSAIIPRQFINMTDINVYSNTPYLSKYDWSHIPAELHDSTLNYDANLLSYFLRDCGYSISMTYNTNSSSSTLDDTEVALEEIFHYKPIIKRTRSSFTSSNWITLLKQEISAGRPILYRGQGTQGGHAFVLFGYTSTNKFRINWGWNGSYINCEYSLDAFSPPGATFNEEQAALFGVEPNYPQCSTYYFLKQNDVNSSLFEIQKNGIILTDSTHGEIRISSNQKGCIYARDAIVIYHPFVIEQGADVHIALRDIHCGEEREVVFEDNEKIGVDKRKIPDRSVEQIGLVVSPNPAKDYVEIIFNETLTDITIFNTNGEMLMCTTNTIISTTNFHQGLYIVRARTSNGSYVQTKFIKQ